jgi:hypothetical protein
VCLGVNQTGTHVDNSNQSFTCSEHNTYDKILIYGKEQETVCRVLENYFNWRQHDLRGTETQFWGTKSSSINYVSDFKTRASIAKTDERADFDISRYYDNKSEDKL